MIVEVTEELTYTQLQDQHGIFPPVFWMMFDNRTGIRMTRTGMLLEFRQPMKVSSTQPTLEFLRHLVSGIEVLREIVDPRERHVAQMTSDSLVLSVMLMVEMIEHTRSVFEIPQAYRTLG